MEYYMEFIYREKEKYGIDLLFFLKSEKEDVDIW